MEFIPLPRKNKRKEAKIDGDVLKWFEKNHPFSIIVEVKMKKGGKLADHQKKLVKKIAKERKFTYKFPDMGRRTPLDGISLKNLDVAVCWCEGRSCVCTINETYEINIKV